MMLLWLNCKSFWFFCDYMVDMLYFVLDCSGMICWLLIIVLIVFYLKVLLFLYVSGDFVDSFYWV